jgi:hypothetical protein
VKFSPHLYKRNSVANPPAAHPKAPPGAQIPPPNPPSLASIPSAAATGVSHGGGGPRCPGCWGEKEVVASSQGRLGRRQQSLLRAVVEVASSAKR